MIADDTDAIRDALKKLEQGKVLAKVLAGAEAARKAESAKSGDGDAKPPTQRPLFQEPGAPFKGFFVAEDGKPDSNFDFDEAAWDEWDQVTLDSGITAESAPLFMWGKISADPPALSSDPGSSDNAESLPNPPNNWTVPNGAPFRQWAITDAGDIKPVGWIWNGNGKPKRTP